MQIFDYRDGIPDTSSRLLPSEINEARWILFHGTTNVSEKLIDEKGFKWRDAPYSRQDVEDVLAIFRKMDWAGLGTDAYLALDKFSLSTDFGDKDDKPVYFSHIAEVTIGYTMRNRACGETAGCLLYALNNLETFLKDEAVQEKFRKERYLRLFNLTKRLDLPNHFHKIMPEEATAKDCKDLVSYLKRKYPDFKLSSMLTMFSPNPNRFDPWEEDLNWLNEQMNSLVGLQSRLKERMESYTHGVVYAVNFEGVNYKKINNLNNGMHIGIACYDELEPERIVAKVLLNSSQRMSVLPYPHDELPKLKFGILGALLSDKEREEEIEKLEQMGW